MKYIILVRHGRYDYDRMSIDSTGQQQMEGLGKAIKSLLNGKSVRILTSTAKWAEQSADILAKIFGAKLERQECLWTGPRCPRNIRTSHEMVGEIIQKTKSDVLIMVLHLEYSDSLPRFIRDSILGGGSDFPEHETGKGEAWVIDCEAKTCTHMTPKYN